MDVDENVYVDEKAFTDVATNKKKTKKVLSIIFITLFTVLIVAYFVMVYITSKRFNPGTIIDGRDMTFKTVDEASEIIKKDYDDYKIKVKYRDGEGIIKGSDIGYNVDVSGSLKEIMNSQNPYLWFRFDKTEEYTSEKIISFSSEKIEDVMELEDRLDKKSMIKPENPKVVLNGDEYEAVPGDEGTEIDMEKFQEGLEAHLMAMDDEYNVEAEGCYITPSLSVDSPSIQECVRRANDILHAEVFYLYGETKVPAITSEDIAGLITIDKMYRIMLDRDEIDELLEEFARTHDTFNKERSFKAHDGKTVKIPATEYGWEINLEGEGSRVYNDILSGTAVTREPEFIHKGYAYSVGGSGTINDIGDSFAEVDLSNQKVYLYVDGVEVLASDCVSGKVTAGMSTPAGLYQINIHQRGAILRGGEEPVPVDYWMRFVRGIGFHDATWRYAFGGDIYYANGSHGCVNLPYESARIMFNNTEVGTPVVCYWRE